MKTSYKTIIKNIIKLQVREYVENRIDGYLFEQEITLRNEDKDFQYPRFSSKFKIGYQEYKVIGYVDDYGEAIICSISYEYDYYETYEDIEKRNVKHKCVWVHGDDLKYFTF